MTVSALRDGIKARLATISGLRTYDTVPDDIATPAAVVMPGEPLIMYDATFRGGSDDYRFEVLLLVQFGSERAAQDALDGYLARDSAANIKTAIEGDGTLAGAAHWARVVSVGDYGLREYAGVRYLSCVFAIEVTA